MAIALFLAGELGRTELAVDGGDLIVTTPTDLGSLTLSRSA